MHHLLVSSFVLSGALATAQDSAAPSPVRPNVILIVADDLDIGIALDTRRPDTGDYAYPALRSLRARGVEFTNAFVTHPLCGPSRASILTGQYPHHHGVVLNNNESGEAATTLEREPTLTTWLHDGGYWTALVGKYINGYGKQGTTTPNGWDHWYAITEMRTYSEWKAVRNGELEERKGTANDYQTDVLAREAVSTIERAAAQSKPFFLALDFVAPHDVQEGAVLEPQPAHRHVGAFQKFEPVFPPSFDEEDLSDKPKLLCGVPRIGSAQRLAIVRRMRARREAMLAVDEAIGAVAKSLSDRGLDSRTVILFTSDNGYEQGEHRLLTDKERAYEEAIRVPLIACGPGIPAGATCDAMVLNIDLAPTIAELAHATATRELDGRSWLPLLRDPATPWRNDFLVTGVHVLRFFGVRTRTQLYVEYDRDQDGQIDGRELYWLAADERNATADPFELTSLHADERFKDVVESLHARLEALRACHGANCW